MADPALPVGLAASGLPGAAPAVPPGSPALSVLVPVLNDAVALRHLLAWFAGFADPRVEILVIDGGSSDGSPQVAAHAHVTAVLCGATGRGAQLALGCAHARGRWLWMLHADSAPEPDCLEYLYSLGDRQGWGRFDVRLEGRPLLRLVARMMNLRSRVTGICTGDQGMFVHRELLAAAGGMPAQPLMEDIELSRRLKALCRPRCRRERIGTSPRRWLRRGILRTVLSMWWFRLRYWLGVDPDRLAREYYR